MDLKSKLLATKEDYRKSQEAAEMTFDSFCAALDLIMPFIPEVPDWIRMEAKEGDIHINLSWNVPARLAVVKQLETLGWEVKWDNPREPQQLTWLTTFQLKESICYTNYWWSHYDHRLNSYPKAIMFKIFMFAREDKKDEHQVCLVEKHEVLEQRTVTVYDVHCPDEPGV